MNKQEIVCCATLIVLACACASVAGPIEADGAAPGTGASARNEALNAAQLHVLTLYFEQTLHVRDLSAFAPILDRAPDYIESFQIVRQGQAGDAHRVTIQAELAKDRLLSDAAAQVAPRLSRAPRVVIAVAERSTPEEPMGPPTDGLLEQTLAAALTKARLEVAPSAEVRAHFEPSVVVARVAAEPESAARLALENLADIAVLCDLVYGVEPIGVNTVAHRARLNVRVLRGADASLLDERTSEIVVQAQAGTDAGRRQALEDVVGKAAPSIAAAATLGMYGLREAGVTVTVHGAGVAGAESLRDRAARVPGVRRVDVLFATERITRLLVYYDGPLVDLAEALTGSGLRVHRAIDREIELTKSEE